jgi:hypothetical protein
MSRLWIMVAVLVGAASLAGRSEAFTPKKKSTLSVSASGVTESTTFEASQVVVQGTADTAGTLDFGTGGNTFRDSGKAIKVVVDTNVAANRLIFYTNNLGTGAVPKACLDTSKGVDGAGLVGVTDCATAVPMVWGVVDVNDDYSFTAVPSPGIGATNAVFLTDLAHVATFTAKNSALDNLAMKRCSDDVVVTNAPGNGLYPQFFGSAGADLDLCRQSDGSKVLEAEELSKNIAVVAFSFLGTKGLATNTITPGDPAVDVTSPIYVPIAADFRKATAQNYATNTLTLELVTQ